MYESLSPLFYNGEEEDRVNPTDNTLFTPKEALRHGNLYKNQYVGYKNYVPKIKAPKNKKETLMHEIMSLEFTCLDLALVIYVYPTNKEYIALYKRYMSQLEELKRNYDKEYGSICSKNGVLKDGYFDYVTSPSPWLGVY